MQTQWIPEARRPARLGEKHELSRAARTRLDWLEWHRGHGGNVALTCRHYGISRQTFYRWRRRFDGKLAQLEDHSHRPLRRRRPTWSPQQADAVLALRRQYPRWAWELIYNTVRPHQALGYRTPWEFLQELPRGAPTKGPEL